MMVNLENSVGRLVTCDQTASVAIQKCMVRFQTTGSQIGELNRKRKVCLMYSLANVKTQTIA